MDGKDRSLYLWRRVYGDNQAPSAGFDIEEPGAKPARYEGLLSRLRLKDQQMFWNAIWGLSNDPEALQQYGIKAVYGNAVYKKLRPASSTSSKSARPASSFPKPFRICEELNAKSLSA